MSKLNFKKEIGDKYFETYMLLRNFAGEEPSLFVLMHLADTDEDNSMPLLSVDARLMVYGSFYCEESKSWLSAHKVDLTKYIIDNSLPSVGYRNYSDRAIYVSQMPTKQWKRGVAYRQLHFTSNSGVKGMLSQKVDMGEIYFPVFPPISVAVEDIISGDKDSVAINEDYALGVLLPSEAVYLFYKTNLIGVIDKVNGEYVAKLPISNAYLVEDVEQYITCEVI